METNESSQPRVTQTLRQADTPSVRSPVTAVNRLSYEHVQKRVWMGIALGSLTLSAVMPVFLIREMRKTQMVFAVDGAGTIYSGPLEVMTENSPVFREIALQGTLAAFTRSPVGFDLPEMVEAIFTERSRLKLKVDLERQMPDIEARNLHQKPTMKEFVGLAEKQGVRIVQVNGDLIRAGAVNGLSVSESVPFKALYSIVPNPNLVSRKVYPFLIADLKLQIGNQEVDTAPVAPTVMPKPVAQSKSAGPGGGVAR